MQRQGETKRPSPLRWRGAGAEGPPAYTFSKGFTLTELLVVITILLVLAALLFPVFNRAKTSANLSKCEGQLRQVAIAMHMYRDDQNGQLWLEYMDQTGGYTTAGRFRYPWNDWLALEPYLKTGNLVWCPVPHPHEIYVRDNYHVRRWAAAGLAGNDTLTVRHAFDPEPGRIVAYCASHTIDELDRPEPRDAAYAMMWKGNYVVAREDGSTKIVPSSALKVSYLWADGQWHDEQEKYAFQAWVFPGEPWPPNRS
jgi:prepilin-type N-terminal cleavage/methylation domain-containing protein